MDTTQERDADLSFLDDFDTNSTTIDDLLAEFDAGAPDADPAPVAATQPKAKAQPQRASDAALLEVGLWVFGPSALILLVCGVIYIL